MRVACGLGYDDDHCFLVGPEYDNNWNQWMVAYNEAAVGDDADAWVVRRTVRWWGKYTDWYE